MKNLPVKTIELYRIVISGLLLVFSIRILFELSETIFIGIAFSILVIGFILAKSVTKHFGHNHIHTGDSPIDVVPITVLIFANIAHPAVDGFSLAQTFQFVGIFPGFLFLISIVFHEIIRQSALVEALGISSINWKWIVGTAFLGILFGVSTSIFGSDFFHRYENIADLATLFSYSFIISEFYFLGKEKSINKNIVKFFILGIIFGIIILKLTHPH